HLRTRAQASLPDSTQQHGLQLRTVEHDQGVPVTMLELLSVFGGEQHAIRTPDTAVACPCRHGSVIESNPYPVQCSDSVREQTDPRTERFECLGTLEYAHLGPGASQRGGHGQPADPTA